VSSFEEFHSSQFDKRKPKREPSAEQQDTRRSPQDIIWGWGEDDIRHQGILERLSNLEKGFLLLISEHRKQTVFLWIILASIWLDLAGGHLQTTLPTLQTLLRDVLFGSGGVPGAAP
jgi:hypothetical protein